MDERRILEEQLRHAANLGDIDTVRKLINLGVDVNARHSINGWTPLHWAAKRNYSDVVVLLLNSGADQNIKAEKGETPALVTTNPYIQQLLSTPPDHPRLSREESPVFIPEEFNYLVPRNRHNKVEHVKEQEKVCQSTSNLTVCQPVSNLSASKPASSLPVCQEELVLKIRVANSNDSDFIEVDLPCNALSYQSLMKLCCDELEINPAQVVKLRKLPNTKIRRDKDVQRLQNLQEIEVVLFTSASITSDPLHKSMQHANGSTVPITPTNNYQSISKKDQTILY